MEKAVMTGPDPAIVTDVHVAVTLF